MKARTSDAPRSRWAFCVVFTPACLLEQNPIWYLVVPFAPQVRQAILRGLWVPSNRQRAVPTTTSLTTASRFVCQSDVSTLQDFTFPSGSEPSHSSAWGGMTAGTLGANFQVCLEVLVHLFGATRHDRTVKPLVTSARSRTSRS